MIAEACQEVSLMPAGRNSQDRGRAMVARILKDVEGRDTEEIELFRDGRDPHLTAGSQIPDTESSPQRRNVGGVVPEVIGIADAQLPRWRGPGRGRNTKAGASKRQGAEGQKPPAAQPATRWLARRAVSTRPSITPSPCDRSGASGRWPHRSWRTGNARRPTPASCSRAAQCCPGRSSR